MTNIGQHIPPKLNEQTSLKYNNYKIFYDIEAIFISYQISANGSKEYPA